MISKRLTVLSFAAIQSSVISLTNMLFDLASSPFAESFLSDIREEVQLELQRENRTWTKECLARMIHVDSALRESMRLCGFVCRGVMKMVVAREGVTLPDGTHLPYGTKIGVTAYAIHHDEATYTGAYVYDAFRFSRPSKDAARLGVITASPRSEGHDNPTRKMPSLVTTSDKFMAFSHGRHAW
jgi:cytochrome P450